MLTRSFDQAEDLVQEALLRAVAGARTWRPGHEVRPWLLAILHNTHVSRQRRRSVEAAVAEQASWVTPTVLAPPQLERVHLSQTMAALMELPEEQREILILVAVEGLSYQDAAAILEIPIGTLMSRLARAREALRAATGRGEAPSAKPAATRPSLRLVR